MTLVASYLGSCSYYINAMCEHFKLMFDSIRKDVDENETETNPIKIQISNLRIIKKLAEVVKFHIKMTE